MTKASIPWSCKQIHKMVTNKSIVFDNVIQRGYVWDKKRQSLFIDTILRDYITPPMYMIKDGRKIKTPKGEVAVFDCLDGKQRAMTITKFKNNEFALVNLETIKLEDGTVVELNGLTYDTLPEELKDAFDTYSITVYYLTDITKDEVIETMSRLNNGKPLTNTEISRIKAVDLKGIDEIADHPMFKQMFSEKAINSYQDEDTVIKTHMVLNAQKDPSFIADPSAYNLDNADVRKIFETVTFDNAEKQSINEIYSRIADIHTGLIENKKKRIAGYISKRTHIIALAPVIRKMIDEGKNTADGVNFIIDFFSGAPSKNNDYNDNCKEGSNHGAKVYARINAIQKEYTTYFN